MKEYENAELGVSFSLPVSLTVREQLAFRERVFVTASEDLYSRYWAGAVPLLKDWECEDIPDPAAVDLDVETRVQITDIVNWVSNTVALHMTELEDVPKNS
jgi:hypothetical protein